MQPDNPVVSGIVLRRPAIQSPNYVAGSQGWTINADGSAEFNNVTIRNGTVVSGTALYYAGPPALGNLVASISAAAGVDSFGNAYLAGIVTYGAKFITVAADGSEVMIRSDLGYASIAMQPANPATYAPGGIRSTQGDTGTGGATTLTGAALNTATQIAYTVWESPDGTTVTAPLITFHAHTGSIIEDATNHMFGATILQWAITYGNTADTNLYRSAAGQLSTDGNLTYGTSGTAETWHTATLLNNFTAGGPPSLMYRRAASPPNCVQVCGTILSGVTTGSGTGIATLPAGYRPATNTIALPVSNASTAANLWLGLQSNGALALHGTWANGATIQINGLFPIDL